MNREQEIIKEIERLNQAIITCKEKPSDEHTILMMTHSSLCGELRGIQSQKQKIIEEINNFFTSEIFLKIMCDYWIDKKIQQYEMVILMTKELLKVIGKEQ